MSRTRGQMRQDSGELQRERRAEKNFSEQCNQLSCGERRDEEEKEEERREEKETSTDELVRRIKRKREM